MHTLKLIALSCSLSLPALSHAAPHDTVQTQENLCSAYSQAGMRDCLAQKVAESQVALQRAEEAVGHSLTQWDEDGKYINVAKAKLVASDREFPRYRDTECEFSASLSGGGAGNAHEMGRLACVAVLNNRRAEQLRNAVANLPLR
ncbi:lysozyme inhibitor LprI family protein [Burkholderia sp. Ax-1724]|uniref:lysozyme inhibitor LprI family protein n=1 Tax=Burkholderia sp. Ax-1724 TaxID=2608336 RepID=UPI00141DFFDF|nr:lysozyme inhibitor LprI family protein [Burkholderia sp. Ax-1724]NIF53057.1 DUF1311 domain-containing protein [Burkholderia sp. Ax-1724]